MSFVVDKQTLEDLNIFGRRGRNSIYSLYNRTFTRGGAVVLEHMFLYPLSDAKQINERAGIIRYFHQNKIEFPFKSEWFDSVDQYLADQDERSRLRADDASLARKVNKMLGADVQLKQIQQGLVAAAKLIDFTESFLEGLPAGAGLEDFETSIAPVKTVLAHSPLRKFARQFSRKKMNVKELIEYDNLIRFHEHDKIRLLLHHLFQVDVYIAVAGIARDKGFSYANAHVGGSAEAMVELENVYHPMVPGAVGNNLKIDAANNIIFLTGANMAGKSTFMKSLGIAVYLAHVGFPIAANRMEFTVRDGLFTTINLSDNLNMGFSHFYAEVHRVKQVSEQLASGKNLFVIFDELFRGTNVKDAYEATVAITKAYARHANCIFIVSTHIIEAADELRAACDNIGFVYLPTVMRGQVPHYTYTLTEGVTEDRHGMVIINNEQILEILEDGIQGKGIPPEPGFVTDKQTLDDLNILGKFKNNSIYSLFNKARTTGGERLLEKFFKEPMTEEAPIRARLRLFAEFIRLNASFPVSDDVFSEAESYLRRSSDTAAVFVALQGMRRRALFLMGLKEEYNHALRGVGAAIDTLKRLHRFLKELAPGIQIPELKAEMEKYVQMLEHQFSYLLSFRDGYDADGRVKWGRAIRLELGLRGKLSDSLASLLDFAHRLDVYLAVGQTARELKLAIPELSPAAENVFDLQDGFHPAIPNAVANSVSMNSADNFMFLTGANMAGKSTIMKTIGINFYLAHIGFPVAASSMRFSPKEGIFTSINVPDNLDMGYSHFYAEVLRVKQVASSVASRKNLLVIFDELFKGTNVKDAFDATLAVSKSFSVYRNCHFIISTHIVEVGHELQKEGAQVQYRYMPTIMRGSEATYPYKIAEGISDDRHGMMIIRNEKILDILE